MIVTELLTIARKLNNYEIDPVTGLKVLWTSTTEYKAVVPIAKRWFVMGGLANRNVSSTVNVRVHNSSDAIFGTLAIVTAAAGPATYPSAAFFIGTPWVLDAGEYVLISFGTAQDAGSYCSCVVLEVDV